MKLSDAFPSKFLKESDLDGRALTLTIKYVEMEEVGQKKDRRLVAYFVGQAKGLVVNKTNFKKIADISGVDDSDQWSGVKVVLYPAVTTYGGEETPCIRVKAPTSPASRETAPPALSMDSSDDDMGDEPGFDD